MATEQQPDEAQMRRGMYATVAYVCSRLTEMELNSIYMVAMLGTNPKHVQGYDKVSELFSESDGTRMHQTTIEALGAVWESRCGKDARHE